MFSSIEIVTESRPVGGEAKIAGYFQAYGGLGMLSEERGPAEKFELRWTPKSVVTFVRAGQPGSHALWKTMLPGRCL
jgi:hypothetical protein